MLTNTQIKQYIIDGLNSEKCIGASYFMEKIIQRKTENYLYKVQNSIPLTAEDNELNYRIRNGNIIITNITDFINNIDVNSMSLSLTMSKGLLSTTSIDVILTNMTCSLREDIKEDSPFTNLFGHGIKKFRIRLSYLNDNDTSLSLKITNIALFS